MTVPWFLRTAAFACPHCNVTIQPNWQAFSGFVQGEEGFMQVHHTACTSCGRMLIKGWLGAHPPGATQAEGGAAPLYPAVLPTRPVAAEVPESHAQDLREAAAVLDVSPKASAALSRRLLQHLIRETAGIRKGNLDKEIDALIDSNQLPTDLAHDLDMIRHVGNFAAHPIKATDTGQVVEVEPGEAEALLDLLEELLDFYFVRPARRQEKRDALNAKLAAAGKPLLKGTPEPEDPPEPAVLEPG
jgi:hypothetical protein